MSWQRSSFLSFLFVGVVISLLTAQLIAEMADFNAPGAGPGRHFGLPV
jgi:hypothetical protein